MNDRKRFIARSSPWRAGLLALGSVGFVAACIWLLSIFGTGQIIVLIAAIVGIVFFGTCAILWSREIFTRKPKIEMTTRGIMSALWSQETIPWNAVEDMWIWQAGTERIACLKLKKPDHYPGQGLQAKLAGVNRKMTGADIHVTVTGTDRKADDLFAAMERLSGMKMR